MFCNQDQSWSSLHSKLSFSDGSLKRGSSSFQQTTCDHCHLSNHHSLIINILNAHTLWPHHSTPRNLSYRHRHNIWDNMYQFSSVQPLSHVRLFATPWTTACQASLSITNSWSLLKLMSIESVMPSSHLILCCPLLLLPPIPPSIRVFSSESTLHMRWPKRILIATLIIRTKDWESISVNRKLFKKWWQNFMLE